MYSHLTESPLAAILRILLKNETLGEDVDIAQLAKDTDTYSGSDLKREWSRPARLGSTLILCELHGRPLCGRGNGRVERVGTSTLETRSTRPRPQCHRLVFRIRRRRKFRGDGRWRI